MNSSYSHIKISLEKAKLPAGHLISKSPLLCFIIGLVSLFIAYKLGKSDIDHLFYSFHVSWLFFFSLATGAIFFILIQFAAKVGWSIVLRRLAENVASTMPLFLILLFVMFLGTKVLYHHWLSPEALADKVIQEKAWYLNVPFFYARSIFYLVMFSIAAIYFAHNSAKQDETGNYGITYKLQNASYPFLIILGFCVTFASFDWIMSLDPHWYSTIFGLYFFASCYVAFFALLIILARLTWSDSKASFAHALTVEHYHDLGKLLFGHSCFWAYAAFCQYFLIWYGNLPEETKWFAIRENNGWGVLFVILIVGHFVIPFFFLMARRAKRSRRMLVLIAFLILCMHLLDIYWLVMPSFYEMGPEFHSVDIFCFLGIAGIFFSIIAFLTKHKAVIPVEDPRLYESMTYDNG